MNNNRGCINWLEQEFLKLESTVGVLGVFYELLEQAKAMHKEEIMNARRNGSYKVTEKNGETRTNIQYYNETFGGNNE